MDFCQAFHSPLISTRSPHPNPLACVLLFSACLWDGDIKGIVGPPHTTLYQSGIPLCTLDFTPKHFPPLTLLWQRLQISSDSLLPLMCLHSITLKNEIKPWPHDAFFTPGFGWVHWPSVLHTLCCFRIFEKAAVSIKSTAAFSKGYIEQMQQN